MNTIKVYWKGKFNGALVTINAADFDPTMHRHAADGRWPNAEPLPAAEEAALTEREPIAEPKKPSKKK
jgi:hypothetical protein